MSALLEGKTAVVTGAASGNGRSIATQFANHGADTVVADVRREPAMAERPTDEVIAEDTTASATYVECNVSDREDIEAAVAAAEQFGGVDVMVNNVGINERPHDFFDIPDDVYQEVMDVNLRSAYWGAQIAAERMTDGGSILNMSSVDGLRGEGTVPVYCASKGGMKLLTYSLAAKLADRDIRVNAIHPGVIETNMTTTADGTLKDSLEERFIANTPMGRGGKPEEVGNVAVFLASELASYVTGESILVDGGFTNTTP